MAHKSIAIIGGGITGLSSAFHLSRRFPDVQITLFERSRRLGGWINSRHADVKANTGARARICLESGPRTLRPNHRGILELINLLRLDSSIISTSRSASASRNRFLHIPGKDGLIALPSSPFSFLTSPSLVSLIAFPALREPFRAANRVDSNHNDESVESFLSRRFGAPFARTLGSALVHGIYAADARILSLRAAFPTLWNAETRGKGSVVRGFLSSKEVKGEELRTYDLGDMRKRMHGVSAFSFQEGMETIPRALEAHLMTQSNVSIRSGEEVVRLHFTDGDGDAEVYLASGEAIKATRVISTIPLPRLESIQSNLPPLPHLSANPSSSVTVINIIFPPTKSPIHPPGFGYLIPRPVSGYEPDTYNSSPKRDSRCDGFLGTVFDSCTLSAQDSGDAGFTKLTVMMGGPHNLSHHQTEPSYVLSQLARHLKRRGSEPLPEPVYYVSHEQRDCIPTPTVGHLERMAILSRVLHDPSGSWKGRLEVIGAGVGGVSVGDCIESGRNVGSMW